MRSWFMAFILILGLVGCDSGEQTPPASDAENPLEAALPNLFEANIGTVNFPVLCTADAARVVERGLTLLHHMMYENARLAFGMAENLDGNCPLALWGQAMTIIHPLWPDNEGWECIKSVPTSCDARREFRRFWVLNQS